MPIYRRKDRKAALAAKILARADGVHEIITGLGQKDSRSSLTDDPSTVTPVAAVTAALPSTGDDLKNTPYSRNDVIPARGISDIASDAPCNAAREGGGGRTVTGQTADGPSNAFGGEAWGDAGYEAVTVGRQRVHAADVKTRAGTDRRAPSYGNDDSGHCSVPPRAGTADITAQGVEEGRQKTGLPSRGASNDSARSSGARSEKRTKSKVKAKREGPSSSSSATSLLLSSRQGAETMHTCSALPISNVGLLFCAWSSNTDGTFLKNPSFALQPPPPLSREHDHLGRQ